MFLLVEERGYTKPVHYLYSDNKEALIKEAYIRSRSYEEFDYRSWERLTKEEQDEYREHCCSPYAYVHVIEIEKYSE